MIENARSLLRAEFVNAAKGRNESDPEFEDFRKVMFSARGVFTQREIGEMFGILGDHQTLERITGFEENENKAGG